jgi:hypothetical protein
MSDLTVIHGNLGLYATTETEGYCWVIADSEPEGPVMYMEDMIHILEKGDLLTVFNQESGKKVWQGYIDLDYSINTDDRGYQFVMEHPVAGLQKGMAPEEWAEMFFSYLPATLVRTIPDPS